MRIVFNNYLSNRTSAQGIMIHETIEALREFHEVLLVQNGKSVDSNAFRDIKRNRVRRLVGRFVNEPRNLLINGKRMFLERGLLSAYCPDVVINLYAYLSFSMPLLTKIRSIPQVIFMDSPVVHETKTVDKDHLHFPAIPEFIEKQALKSCDAVITISERLKDYFVNRYGIEGEKIHVIPNGVDVDRFRTSEDGEEVISKYGLKGKFVVGFVGAIREWSNIELLIEVMDRIIRRYPDVCFLLVGDGPKRADIARFAEEVGSNKVILTGYVSPREVAKYISIMDVTVAPYKLQGDLFYGSSMKVLEYMACGKALIANRFSPVEAVIQDGYNGLLVDPGSSSLFEEAIIRLREDGELRSVLGERARKTIIEKYTWVHRAKAISQVCESVYKKYASEG
jgi:glycosyltransferase involved in cell wall biosynthesis